MVLCPASPLITSLFWFYMLVHLLSVILQEMKVKLGYAIKMEEGNHSP